MKKHYFTHWLRSKQLPLLLSFMLVAMATVQNLHEQLEHHGVTSIDCEYCILAQGNDTGLAPLSITFPTVFAHISLAVLGQTNTPLTLVHAFSARAPPATSNTF